MKKRLTTAILSAVMLSAAVLGHAAPAMAAERLTVKGTVMLAGGTGNVTDVKITVEYSYPIGSPFAEGSPVWTGSPMDNSGNFSIPTEAYKDGLQNMKVTASLDGYTPASDGLGYNEDTTEKLVLVPENESGVIQIGGKFFMEDGQLLQDNLCPTITLERTLLSGNATVTACGGIWGCNTPAGSAVTVRPSLDGYYFIPESITVEDLVTAKQDFNFEVRPINSSADSGSSGQDNAQDNTGADAGTEGSAQPVGAVTFYVDANYKGDSISLDEGEYNSKQLGVLGNDRLSSLKVPAGYRVTLYEHSGFAGRTVVCTEDVSFLKNKPYNFNDITSSIKIERISESQDGTDDEIPEEDAMAEFYADANYKGNSISLGVGRHPMSELGKLGNDKLSSLKVPEGYTVILYEHGNFTGRTVTCTQNVSFLKNAPYNFNDITSSIEITKN